MRRRMFDRYRVKPMFDENVVGEIVKYYGDGCLIHGVIREGAVDQIPMLLANDCDPNQQDMNGDTPLHLIAKILETSDNDAMYGTVGVLLDNGADPDIRNNANHTVYDLAQDNDYLMAIL